MASVNQILADLTELAVKQSDVITAATITQIMDDLNDYRPNRKAVGNEAVIKYGVSRKKNVMLVTGSIKGETEGEKTHEQQLEFDTEFSTDRKEGFVPVGLGGANLWMKPITGNTEVRVRCSCSDYYYSFWAWNRKGRSHYGEDMPAYTSTGTRPPRNPEHFMGMCKHLLECLNVMKIKRLFV